MNARMLILVVMALTAPGPAALAAPPPPVPANRAERPPREARIGWVISSLRQEAIEASRNQWNQALDRPTFAQDRNWTVPAEDVVRVLARRRLASSPPNDAYIKWQLLSFLPDLSALDSRTIRRIDTAAPDPANVRLPPLPAQRGSAAGSSLSIGMQQAYVRDQNAVVGDGAAASAPRVGVAGRSVRLSSGSTPLVWRNRWVLRRILKDAQRHFRLFNRPIHAYRRDLADALPGRPALRLGLILQDVRARLAANDPTARRAMQRLTEEARAIVFDRGTISAQERQTLIRWTRAVGSMSGEVVTGVNLHAVDRLFYEHQRLFIPEDRIEQLIKYLNLMARDG